MSDENTVLCVSTAVEVADHLTRSLQGANPHISVVVTTDPTDGRERIEAGEVDCVVTDECTVEASPSLHEAVRKQYPDVPLLTLSEEDIDGERALSETIDFVDLGNADGELTLAGWVANAVVCGSGVASQPVHSSSEGIVHEIKRLLADATTPMDIEHAVCEQLITEYTFAWIGEYDPGERQVVPWVTATTADHWPTAQSFGVGPKTPAGVLDELLRTRELQLVEDIDTHPTAVPWRQIAIENDCVAAAFIPLVANDELHGVLGVYADAVEGFSDVEVSMLKEIGETTAHVLGTMAIRGEIEQQERVLERYERLVETVGDGMYALDSGGHFMTINNGLLEMTGYTREGLLGEHVSLLLNEDDSARREETIDRLAATDDAETQAIEITIHCKDGSTVPCENQIALLPGEESARGSVGVLRDITERKKRERELERQNERLEAFASIVSHDLRNPLSVAQGYVELVAEQVGEMDTLENVRDALTRMEDIIADVLALARHGQTVTETEQMTLSDVARSAWSNVTTHGATIDIESSGPIAADRSRLLRSFENLFRNAIEHGGTDVTIRVGVLSSDEADDSTPETSRSTGFYVEDDGPGMPEHVRENAFDSSFTTSDDGLGIGLWVVREVASAHGWTVDVVEGTDGGARFEFRDVRPRPE